MVVTGTQTKKRFGRRLPRISCWQLTRRVIQRGLLLSDLVLQELGLLARIRDALCNVRTHIYIRSSRGAQLVGCQGLLCFFGDKTCVCLKRGLVGSFFFFQYEGRSIGFETKSGKRERKGRRSGIGQAESRNRKEVEESPWTQLIRLITGLMSLMTKKASVGFLLVMVCPTK